MSERLSWRPGLDGLRAIAVAAVVAYHLAPDQFRGGFLGVSLFFTLSGYLITALLLDETRREGRISLSNFWTRRMRRLWPLSWLTFAAVAVAGALGVWGADAGSRLGGELAASVAQVANWWELGHQGYVGLFGRPSPLRHIWSLAIEEQFYVVWPLMIWLFARRGRSLSIVIAAGIAASLAMTLLVSGSPDRVYLGTDTRASELLIGAALALAWRAHPLTGLKVGRGRVALGLGAVVAAAVLVTAAVRLRPDDPIWGQGGFLVIAVCSATLVASAVTDGVISTVLSWRPLGWVGRRSYAIYLVHWPIWVALPIAWPVATRVGITVGGALVTAEVLHVIVEKPVRERRVPVLALRSLTVLALVTMTIGGVASRSDGGVERAVSKTLVKVADPTTTAAPPGPTTTTIPCPPTTLPPAPLTGYKNTLQGGVDPTVDPCTRALRVLVLGDSTARGLANGLRAQANPKLQVWDRSVLSCSLGGEKRCPDWRQTWPADVAAVKPDVVLVDMIPIATLDGVDSSNVAYLSDSETTRRVTVLTEVMKMLTDSGSTVIWLRNPHHQMPAALFYCRGRARGTMCEADWVDRWNESLDRAAAAVAGTVLIDGSHWPETRPDPPADRLDGIHYTGQALTDFAAWISPQVLAIGAQRSSKMSRLPE